MRGRLSVHENGTLGVIKELCRTTLRETNLGMEGDVSSTCIGEVRDDAVYWRYLKSTRVRARLSNATVAAAFSIAHHQMHIDRLFHAMLAKGRADLDASTRFCQRFEDALRNLRGLALVGKTSLPWVRW